MIRESLEKFLDQTPNDFLGTR
jgi:ribonucleoside-triphosphate reductase (thioredoxin)